VQFLPIKQEISAQKYAIVPGIYIVKIIVLKGNPKEVYFV